MKTLETVVETPDHVVAVAVDPVWKFFEWFDIYFVVEAAVLVSVGKFELSEVEVFSYSNARKSRKPCGFGY